MSAKPLANAKQAGLPLGSKLFMAGLVVTGAYFLGHSAYRAVWQAPEPVDLATEVRAYLSEREVRPLSAPLREILAAPAASLVKAFRPKSG